MRLQKYLQEEVILTSLDVHSHPPTVLAYMHENYPAFCKAFEIPKKAKVLGSGAAGHALDMGNKKVLKITTDVDEAKASAFISDRNLKYTWKVYFAGKINVHFPAYIIIGEKLQPINDKDKDVIDNLHAYNDGVFSNGTESDVFKKFEDVHDMYIRKGKLSEGKKINLMDAYTSNSKLVDWMWKALLELKNAGVKWSDNHSDNVMKSGSTWKFIDLGYSKAPESHLSIIQ